MKYNKKTIDYFVNMKNKNKYYSTGIDGWWTQNPKSKWIITK